MGQFPMLGFPYVIKIQSHDFPDAIKALLQSGSLSDRQTDTEVIEDARIPLARVVK